MFVLLLCNFAITFSTITCYEIVPCFKAISASSGISLPCPHPTGMYPGGGGKGIANHFKVPLRIKNESCYNHQLNLWLKICQNTACLKYNNSFWEKIPPCLNGVCIKDLRVSPPFQYPGHILPVPPPFPPKKPWPSCWNGNVPDLNPFWCHSWPLLTPPPLLIHWGLQVLLCEPPSKLTHLRRPHILI